MNRVIPTTMISQHPDHANVPYWHTDAFITTAHETHECFLSFSELGVSEYKWDWEGKLVDESVVERLLMNHYDYFRDNPLGKEKFLTFRLPNPAVEHEYRLGRAFMGLLSAAGLAQGAQLHSPPLFEVILPMTESAQEMIAIQEAFQEISSLKHYLYSSKNGTLRHIELIPLFEQIRTIAHSDEIIETYLSLHQDLFGFQPTYLRPYIARSDPALNSGLIPTVLAIKIALSAYMDLEERHGIKLFPILGAAALPFRGGLSPETIPTFLQEYGGIRTALIQSAFRYDYPKDQVLSALRDLDGQLPHLMAVRMPLSDRQQLLELMDVFEKNYQLVIEEIAPLISKVASLLPKRRERVQHIGLFGYSRGLGKVTLPRAIGFTGALYSLGVPPELIASGRNLVYAKKMGRLDLVEKYYVNLRGDLLRAGYFLNRDNLKNLLAEDSGWKDITIDIEEVEDYLQITLGPQSDIHYMHLELTTAIYKKIMKGEDVGSDIVEAAKLRRSIG